MKWRLGDVTGSAMMADQLAAIATSRGDGRRAAGLLGVAQRMRTDAQRSRGGVDRRSRPEAVRRGIAPEQSRRDPYGLQASREHTETEARALIGDACYDHAFAQGLIMESPAAVAWIRDV